MIFQGYERMLQIFSAKPLRAGFEPAREYPIGFRVQRLNHSAIAAANRRITVADK